MEKSRRGTGACWVWQCHPSAIIHQPSPQSTPNLRSEAVQAHARVMAREEVTQLDALVAVMLIDTSMEDSALMQCNPMLHSLEDDPQMVYLRGQLSS